MKSDEPLHQQWRPCRRQAACSREWWARFAPGPCPPLMPASLPSYLKKIYHIYYIYFFKHESKKTLIRIINIKPQNFSKIWINSHAVGMTEETLQMWHNFPKQNRMTLWIPKNSVASQRPYSQRRRYPTPTAWELISNLIIIAHHNILFQKKISEFLFSFLMPDTKEHKWFFRTMQIIFTAFDARRSVGISTLKKNFVFYLVDRELKLLE